MGSFPSVNSSSRSSVAATSPSKGGSTLAASSGQHGGSISLKSWKEKGDRLLAKHASTRSLNRDLMNSSASAASPNAQKRHAKILAGEPRPNRFESNSSLQALPSRRTNSVMLHGSPQPKSSPARRPTGMENAPFVALATPKRSPTELVEQASFRSGATATSAFTFNTVDTEEELVDPDVAALEASASVVTPTGPAGLAAGMNFPATPDRANKKQSETMPAAPVNRLGPDTRLVLPQGASPKVARGSVGSRRSTPRSSLDQLTPAASTGSGSGSGSGARSALNKFRSVAQAVNFFSKMSRTSKHMNRRKEDEQARDGGEDNMLEFVKHILGGPEAGSSFDIQMSQTPLAASTITKYLKSHSCSAQEIQRLYRTCFAHDRDLEFYVVAAKQLIHKGEPLIAYDILNSASSDLDMNVAATRHKVLQLSGFALAQAGSTQKAIEVFEELLMDQGGQADEETLGVMSRCYKDMAMRSGDIVSRQELLEHAYQGYRRSYLKDGKTSYYTGINTATLALLLGDDEEAVRVAEEVVALCQEHLKGWENMEEELPPDAYWVLATMGEATIILGDLVAAASYYRKAVAAAPGDYFRLCSTKRQMKMLLEHQQHKRMASPNHWTDEKGRATSPHVQGPDLHALHQSGIVGYVQSHFAEYIELVAHTLHKMQQRIANVAKPTRVDDSWAMAQAIASAACKAALDAIENGRMLDEALVADITRQVKEGSHTAKIMKDWLPSKQHETWPAEQAIAHLKSRFNIDDDVLMFASQSKNGSRLFNPSTVLNFVFKIPSVLAMVVADSVDSLVLAPGGEDGLAARYNLLAESHNAGFVFTSMCTHADIIMAEVMIARGGEVFAVLPVPRALFEKDFRSKCELEENLQKGMSPRAQARSVASVRSALRSRGGTRSSMCSEASSGDDAGSMAVNVAADHTAESIAGSMGSSGQPAGTGIAAARAVAAAKLADRKQLSATERLRNKLGLGKAAGAAVHFAVGLSHAGLHTSPDAKQSEEDAAVADPDIDEAERWCRRLRRVLNRCAKVSIANDLATRRLSNTNKHYASLILYGMALMKAKTLDTRVERVFVKPHLVARAATSLSKAGRKRGRSSRKSTGSPGYRELPAKPSRTASMLNLNTLIVAHPQRSHSERVLDISPSTRHLRESPFASPKPPSSDSPSRSRPFFSGRVTQRRARQMQTIPATPAGSDAGRSLSSRESSALGFKGGARPESGFSGVGGEVMSPTTADTHADAEDVQRGVVSPLTTSPTPRAGDVDADPLVPALKAAAGEAQAGVDELASGDDSKEQAHDADTAAGGSSAQASPADTPSTSRRGSSSAPRLTVVTGAELEAGDAASAGPSDSVMLGASGDVTVDGEDEDEDEDDEDIVEGARIKFGEFQHTNLASKRDIFAALESATVAGSGMMYPSTSDKYSDVPAAVMQWIQFKETFQVVLLPSVLVRGSAARQARQASRMTHNTASPAGLQQHEYRRRGTVVPQGSFRGLGGMGASERTIGPDIIAERSRRGSQPEEQMRGRMHKPLGLLPSRSSRRVLMMQHSVGTAALGGDDEGSINESVNISTGSMLEHGGEGYSEVKTGSEARSSAAGEGELSRRSSGKSSRHSSGKSSRRSSRKSDAKAGSDAKSEVNKVGSVTDMSALMEVNASASPHSGAAPRPQFFVSTAAVAGHGSTSAAALRHQPSQRFVQGTGHLRRPPSAGSTRMGKQVMMAILFADIVGYSKLDEFEVLAFIKYFLGSVSNLIESYPQSQRPVVRNTWGDAFYFVFKHVRDAGEFALQLSDLVTHTAWELRGLPSNLNIRVSLHAAPVFKVVDPVIGQRNYTGVHTSRAARIEPITPPGSVYCSQAFAAVAETLQAGRPFECTYVGNVPLAKSYGMQPVYVVNWAENADEMDDIHLESDDE